MSEIALLTSKILHDIQYNCDISDAKDHGIYSMCTMVLKMRNLYKWENNIPPWQEPESSELLEWIESKENYWGTLYQKAYQPFTIGDEAHELSDPIDFQDPESGATIVYGAGHGRSMKAVFFLAEQLAHREIEKIPVRILGRELAKEMASPFALVQDGVIIIRTESLRYFLWDQIQELRGTCRQGFHQALSYYNILKDGVVDNRLLRKNFDTFITEEMNLFIYHEVGEILGQNLPYNSFAKLISHFPGSIFEFVCRALKDILADTHPQGPLAYCIREKRISTLHVYLGFLDGLRKTLFPEILNGYSIFLKDGKWDAIEEARIKCRKKSIEMASTIQHLANTLQTSSEQKVRDQFNRDILQPLGLEALPVQN